MSAATDPLIGMSAGSYRLVARLDGGGMGEVYRGERGDIGARVAIKVLHATSIADDANSTQRFLREAQTVNRIDHPGVAKVLDAGRLAIGRPYLVMELLEGESLASRLKRGRLELAEATRIAIDVLDVIAAAHAREIVHRDLKPANVFLTRAGRTVVLDFGVAKLMSAEAELRLTLTGEALGTPHYMAPEQIRNDGVGPRSDLYAMGVVLYEMLCGRRPFDADAVFDVMQHHLARRPPPPRALRPEIPAAVQDVVLTALAKEPDKRFATAAAMRDALRAAAPASASMPSSDAAVSPRRPLPRWIGLGVAAVAIAGVTVVVTKLVGGAPATTSAAGSAAIATVSIDAAMAAVVVAPRPDAMLVSPDAAAVAAATAAATDAPITTDARPGRDAAHGPRRVDGRPAADDTSLVRPDFDDDPFASPHGRHTSTVTAAQATLKSALTTMKRRGIRTDDLPTSMRGLEAEANRALERGDVAAATTAAKALDDAARAIAINRAFIMAKVQRVTAAMKAATLDEAARTALTAQLETASSAVQDGDYPAANRVLNTILSWL